MVTNLPAYPKELAKVVSNRSPTRLRVLPVGADWEVTSRQPLTHRSHSAKT